MALRKARIFIDIDITQLTSLNGVKLNDSPTHIFPQRWYNTALTLLASPPMRQLDPPITALFG